MRALLFLLLVAAPACAEARTTYPLLASPGAPITPMPSEAAPLHVVTRATAVKDPLPVHGASASYGDLEIAMGFAMGTAATRWAERHERAKRLELLVELTKAKADWEDQRLRVALDVRATLRERNDGTYVGQTIASCVQTGALPPERGGVLVIRCMTDMARELASWLEETAPTEVPK